MSKSINEMRVEPECECVREPEIAQGPIFVYRIMVEYDDNERTIEEYMTTDYSVQNDILTIMETVGESVNIPTMCIRKFKVKRVGIANH